MSAILWFAGSLLFLLNVLLIPLDVSAEYFTGLIYLFNNLIAFDKIFPFHEMILAIVLIITIEIIIYLTRSLMGLISIIRGGGKIDI